MKNLHRCDHCGEFARAGGGLFTLYGIEHNNAEDVAICLKCYEKRPYDEGKNITENVAYWLKWLDARSTAVTE